MGGDTVGITFFCQGSTTSGDRTDFLSLKQIIPLHQRPHQIDGITYDGAGTMTNSGTFTYNADGRLTSDGTYSLSYDGSRNMAVHEN